MTTYEARLQDDYLALLKEASNYYMARGDVFTTLQNLTRRLDEDRIPYALIGGLALAAHGFVRMTQYVDILMTREGLDTSNKDSWGVAICWHFQVRKRHFATRKRKCE